MKSKNKNVIPIIFLIGGLIYFLEPVLYGWFQIVNPFIARTIILPLTWLIFVLTLLLSYFLGLVIDLDVNLTKYVEDAFFWFTFLVYLIYYLRIDRSVLPKTQKVLMTLPIVIFPLLFIILLPLGFTSTDRRVATYPLGGRSLLWLSGGSALIRNDAINMMNSTQNEEPLENEIPDSIKKINAWVGIEHHNRLVVLYLGRMFNMADGFGFLFLEKDTDEPNSDYVNGFDFQRIWKLDEGVYFYEID